MQQIQQLCGADDNPQERSDPGGSKDCDPYLTQIFAFSTDLYRVDFGVQPLKPFSSLAFPFFRRLETPLEQPSFGDELVTSCSELRLALIHCPQAIRCVVMRMVAEDDHAVWVNIVVGFFVRSRSACSQPGWMSPPRFG